MLWLTLWNYILNIELILFGKNYRQTGSAYTTDLYIAYLLQLHSIKFQTTTIIPYHTTQNFDESQKIYLPKEVRAYYDITHEMLTLATKVIIQATGNNIIYQRYRYNRYWCYFDRGEKDTRGAVKFIDQK